MTSPLQFVIGDLASDTAEGEAARVLDPLWMLARQWQTGELDGKDSGSPVGVRMAVEAAMLERWQPGAATARGLRAGAQPVEALVEAECWDTSTHPHARLAAETGLGLQQRLVAAGLPGTVALLRVSYPLPLDAGTAGDAASARYVALMAGRVPDGMRLYRYLQPLQAQGRLVAAFGEAPLNQVHEDTGAVARVLDAWLTECATFSPGGVSTAAAHGEAEAWQAERLEYGFAVSARLGGDEVTLAVDDHAEGVTDWYSDSRDASRLLGAAGTAVQRVFAFLPSPVRFAGMPRPRFWELEDGRVSLPRLEQARDDAASRLLVDFALRYGNDWFSAPLPLPIGSVSRIRNLMVTTNFGERWAIGATVAVAGETWRMYALSGVSGAFADVFLAPTPAGQVLESAAVEQVQLARDEVANLGWAVEAVVESAIGLPVDRAEQYARSLAAAGAAPAGAAQRSYRLGSVVPSFWSPLLPARDDAAFWLRGATPRMTASGSIEGLQPWGRVLQPGQAMRVREEEIRAEAIVVERRYRFARSAEGQPVLWIGRCKHAGRGLASCGLRFDTVETDTV